ncbi:oxidative stress survival, Svf1-like protein [Glomus cerebriforme]|uniref:Oxidative stress survival, Svf1-like protein n=1 Tax=Glomus cerebriforme TaxID=658196 RepID=A0A397TG64_9GLOM|nr:oxidative stress survival, Svf1-like protein [Glomus cerebriforme]
MSNIHVAGDLAKDSLYSDVTPKDLEWTLASGSSTETQTFYLATNEGHFAFVQMIHSNIGLWNPTIQFTSRFFGGGINTFKSVNMSNFKLSPDRRSATADNMSIVLNPECNKYTVTLKHKELIVSFDFELIDRGFKIGEGKTYFGQDKSTGFVEHKFWPKGNVKGNIIVDGQAFDVTGVGLFVHAIQGMRPHLIASRWNFINFQSDVASLSMCEFETTPHYGSKKVNQGSLVVNDKLVGVSVKNAAQFLETKLDPETKYNIPTKIKYTWEGKSLETDEHFSVSLDIKLEVLMDKIDVLNEVPYFLKKIVQALVAKPYVYQWFNEAEAHVKIGDNEEFIARGKLFSECSFIS